MAWIYRGNTHLEESDAEKIPFIPLGEADSVDDQESVSTTSQGLPKPWRPSCSKLQELSSKFGLELLPTFLAAIIRPTKFEAAERKLHPTAFLDGIRGFASLFVFFYHLIYGWHVRYGHGFGHANNWYIVQLPIIKLFYAGASMVSIFFVISGFALSYKSLKLLRNGSFESAIHSLASSVFRRPIRLFLPPLTSTFIIMLLIWLGAYEPARSTANDPNIMPGARENHQVRLPTFWGQFSNWLFHSREMCDLFRGTGTNPYDGHLWTIPIEFRYSMLLFLTILGISTTRSTVRTVLIVVLVVYMAYVDNGAGLCFYAGMLTAELWLVTSSHKTISSPEGSERPTALLARPKAALWWICFIVGLYIASIPDWWEETPGYSFLALLVTDKSFWHTTGAFLIVFSASFSPSIQRLFTNSFAQYLGKISYSVYLIHGIFLHTIVYNMIPAMWEITGKDTLAQYELAFGLTCMATIPCVIWAADLFWRWVDIPAVKFAKKVEEVLSVRNGER